MLYSKNIVYSDTALNDTSKIYVAKIKGNIDDLTNKKQEALQNDEYQKALDIKAQIDALNIQLLKLEHQNNSDVVSHFISEWENQFAVLVGQAVSKSTFNVEFPTECACHLSFIQILKALPDSFCDAAFKFLFMLLPYEIPGFARSPYGFDDFLNRTQLNPNTLNEKQIEDAVIIHHVFNLRNSYLWLLHLTSSYL
jgi:hypothetical protein